MSNKINVVMNMNMVDFDLTRNSFGRLVLSLNNDESHEGVVPVRAFPLNAPNEGVALVDYQGRELAWIDRLIDLPEPLKHLLIEELESRELMPEIRKIKHTSSFTPPCFWTVETDRGVTNFVLSDEADIRRIHLNGVLIKDNHGVSFIIRNIEAMDKQSKQYLERFI